MKLRRMYVRTAGKERRGVARLVPARGARWRYFALECWALYPSLLLPLTAVQPEEAHVQSDEQTFRLLCEEMEAKLDRKLTAEERAAVRLSIPALGAAPMVERRKASRDDSDPQAAE